MGCESEPKRFTLNITTEGSGAVEPLSGSKFMDGVTVTLVPYPKDGWIFRQWDGKHSNDIVKIDNCYKILMNENKNIIAVFEKNDGSNPIVGIWEGITEPFGIYQREEGGIISFNIKDNIITTDGSKLDQGASMIIIHPFYWDNEIITIYIYEDIPIVNNEFIYAQGDNISPEGFVEITGYFELNTLSFGVVEFKLARTGSISWGVYEWESSPL